MLGCLLFPFLSYSANPSVIRPSTGPPYRADRILVVPKPGRTAALRAVHQRNRVTVGKDFPAFGHVQVLTLPPGADARNFVARYRRSGEVEFAGLDHWIEPAALPNDPAVETGIQWHLNNTAVPGADIHAPTAWDTVHSAPNIIVAVIDSGIRQTHEDLAANLWTNPGEIPGNGIDDDGNGIVDDVHGINAIAGTGDPNDDTGHGTHVAGILGAVGNNGVGVSGVAWQVQIMPCQFLSANGGSESSLLQCLDYARSNGATVINCSFVAPPDSISPPLSNAFWTVRNEGRIVVAAAGNRGSNLDEMPEYPACFPMDNIVVVTATTRSDGFAGYSYGPNTVHLGAPGSEIYSTYSGFDSHYATVSGTSMAAPCVSGAIALLWERFPQLTYRQIIDRLLATVDPLPSLSGRCQTGGRLNLARALGGQDLELQPATFDWVPTNGMTALNLVTEGVSAQALPFPFHYFGEAKSQIFVGANGLAGFSAPGLDATPNADLPSAGAPNGIICPYWDELDPSSGGQIWVGLLGSAPNRKFVVTWADVPHTAPPSDPTTYTFQLILHETGEIAFQYLEVESGRHTLVSGRSATIGLEDDVGLVGTRFSFNGSPALLTNRQAILFVPHGANAQPSTLALSWPSDSQPHPLLLSGQPGRKVVLSASSDLLTWEPMATNALPASGLWRPDPLAAEAEARFYRGETRP